LGAQIVSQPDDEPSVPELQSSPAHRVWVEKTIASGRSDRNAGEYAVGKALWSPQRDKRGADIYRYMRDVRPGDIVLHLTDNEGITGKSRVASNVEEFSGVPGTEWGQKRSYLVRLQDYEALNPILSRSAVFNSPSTPDFMRLIDQGTKNLFYNKEELNQGAYLTPAPPELVGILNGAYQRASGKLLVAGFSPNMSRRFWIFQNNPNTWDLHAGARHLSEISWLASRYASQIKPGNRVYMWEAGPGGGLIAVGETLDVPAERPVPSSQAPFNRGFDEKRDGQPRVPVSVSQVVDPPLTRKELLGNPTLANLSILKQPRGTNFPVTKEEAEALETAIASRLRPNLLSGVDGYSYDDLLRDTLWSREALDELLEALTESSYQVILAGPPGTGKTWVAKKVVKYLAKNQSSHWRLVQFHPSFSYEQFIQGLRPTLDENKAIKFEPVEGIVLDMVREMVPDGLDYFLIIDEMNRANLPRVLGELMYLFEYRDEAIDLPYTKAFKLPHALRFIGTMNTADKSIRSIDVALRRRFDVFECPADPEILSRYYERNLNSVPGLIEGFSRLNQRLSEHLDVHRTIGHTFFMASAFTPELLCQIWRRKLQPLIQEYFFDQPDLAQGYTVGEFWPDVACE
jgi:MoxR-like ATPase